MRRAGGLIEAWDTEYNTERSHSSLGYRLSEQFARVSEVNQQFLH